MICCSDLRFLGQYHDQRQDTNDEAEFTSRTYPYLPGSLIFFSVLSELHFLFSLGSFVAFSSVSTSWIKRLIPPCSLPLSRCVSQLSLFCIPPDRSWSLVSVICHFVSSACSASSTGSQKDLCSKRACLKRSFFRHCFPLMCACLLVRTSICSSVLMFSYRLAVGGQVFSCACLPKRHPLLSDRRYGVVFVTACFIARFVCSFLQPLFLIG